MKMLTWLGPRQMELLEAPDPHPGPDEVLVRVSAVGICGSEIEGYLGENSIREPPQVFGHEFVGTIDKLGANPGRLTPGTRVVINPLLTCGMCPMCRRNQHNLCLNREIIGAQRPGAMAEFVVVPQSSLYEIPESITDVAASLVEPLAVVIRSVELANLGFLDKIVIFGTGNIGLLLLQVLVKAGAGEILALDTHPDRRNTALRLGANYAMDPLKAGTKELLEPLGGVGADVVFDCVGKNATRKLAHALTRPGGRIVLLGLHDTLSELDLNAVVRWEVTITGSYTYSDTNFYKAIQVLEQGIIDIYEWTEVRPLAAGAQSFADMVDHPSVVSKYILTP